MRVSFGHDDEIRLWMVYHLSDDEENGVVSGMYPDDYAEEVSSYPEWLRFEVDNTGWSDMVAGCSFRELLRWGLENGIAPGQPFLVRFGHPTYSTYDTQDGREYDTEYDTEIVLIEPLPFEEWSARMQRELEYDLEDREALKHLAERRAHERRFNTESMHLRTEHYFGPKDRYWDEMSPPTGIAVKLCAKSLDKNDWPVPLVSGRDDGGDYQKALGRLVAQAGLELPHLSPKFIRSLRPRWV